MKQNPSFKGALRVVLEPRCFFIKMVQIILNFGGNFEKMMIFMIFWTFFRILDLMKA